MSREATRYERRVMRAAVEGDGIARFGPGGTAARMRLAMILIGWIEDDNRLTDAGHSVIANLRAPGHVYRLPGGGPWRILKECPADRHNTTYAARGYRSVGCSMERGNPKCICPRSKALMELHAEQSKEAQRRFYERRKAALPRWWCGPWRILPECPNEGHHATSRARTTARNPVPCICPRALVNLAAYKQQENEAKKQARRAADRRRSAANREIQVRHFSAKDLGRVAAPDFSRGRCTDPHNLAVFSGAVDGRKAAQRTAKTICNGCVLRDQCGAYIVQTEDDKPGSMGGVYGGRDPRDRVEAHKRIKAEEKRDAGDSGDAANGARAVRGRSAADGDGSAPRPGVGDAGARAAAGAAGEDPASGAGDGVHGSRATSHRRTVRASTR